MRGVHRAVAARSFGALGPVGAPVRGVHDAVAAGVYWSLHAAFQAAGRGVAPTSGLLPTQVRELSGGPAGGSLVAMLNSVAGDRLAAAGSQAAICMAVRVGGADVPADRAALAAAFPAAGERLAVFVHGLGGTERSWHARGGDDSLNYGAQLEADTGHTPVYVRYNTGLHVSENGRALAALLAAVTAAWPVPVREMALIGHSMGGLVVRSACHYGQAADMAWVGAVRHVVCLGTPHLGAPMEKAANIAGAALSAVAETRPFAELLNRRSAGMKDLRHGSLVDEDWIDRDPDAFLEDTCREVPFLDTAAHYFIGATVTSDPRHPGGRLVGDLLVRFPSASGQGHRRRIPFEVEHGRHLGGLHHIDLLHRRPVYEQLRAWLSR